MQIIPDGIRSFLRNLCRGFIPLEKSRPRRLKPSASGGGRSLTGFTLIEVLVTAGVLALIATFLGLSLWGFRAGQRLTQQTTLVVMALRDAQQRSIVREDGMEWGVRFTNASSGQDLVTLFQQSPSSGGGISIADDVSSFPLAEGIEFSEPASGSSEVVFTVLSGSPQASLTVSLRKVGSSADEDKKTVKVQTNGVIGE